MYTISKTITISASHELPYVPPEHPCGRNHGHNYAITVVLDADTLGPEGWIIDYGELAPIFDWIKETFDHRYLNDVLHNPTAENLARYIYDNAPLGDYDLWFGGVDVSETPTTSASYRGGPRAK